MIEVTQEMLAAKFGVIFPHLDERQLLLLLLLLPLPPLLTGAEARALGRGGIGLMAQAAGVREATVPLGVSELDSGAEPLGRVRRPGGGPQAGGGGRRGAGPGAFGAGGAR